VLLVGSVLLGMLLLWGWIMALAANELPIR
jgi:hypothetical protein